MSTPHAPDLPDEDKWIADRHSFEATEARIVRYLEDDLPSFEEWAENIDPEGDRRVPLISYGSASEALTAVASLKNMAHTSREKETVSWLRMMVEEKVDKLDVIYNKKALDQDFEFGFVVIVDVLDEQEVGLATVLDFAIEAKNPESEAQQRSLNTSMFGVSSNIDNSRLLCKELEGELRERAAVMFNRMLDTVKEAHEKHGLPLIHEEDHSKVEVDAFGNITKEGVPYVPKRIPYNIDLTPFDPAVRDDDADGAKMESDGSQGE